ncbi:MAG: alkaline phosphatase family protein [Myxococcota bacterium]
MSQLPVRIEWLKSRLLSGFALVSACSLATGLSCDQPQPVPDSGQAVPGAIRLVVVIVIDQLRPERIHPSLPGGLGALVREGHGFPLAEQNHARTETCPGHATILTGRHPGAAGIPSNDFIDRRREQRLYCVADETEQGGVLAEGYPQDPLQGRSPSNLRVAGLGDWLKNENSDSRVYAVSAKDRAAIILAGHKADAAYWLDRKHTGRFTTSRFYRGSLPQWVRGWTGEHVLSGVPPEWVHASELDAQSSRADDHPGEDDSFGRTTPHPIEMEGDLLASIEAFSYTPYLDQRTLDFARQLVEEEGLGEGKRTDLLAVSLSGTDLIGHAYGPLSHESADALRVLDQDLGRFLEFLEERVGREHLLVVLTADHGVQALPEWLEGRSSPCSVASGRVSPRELEADLKSHLDEQFGTSPSPWFMRNHMGFLFFPESRTGVDPEEVEAVAAKWLRIQPGVAGVISRKEIESGWSRAPFADLHAHSLAPGRGPDLFVETEYGCLFSDYPAGTSHGSPHDYDRRVPLVFFGAGIEPGETWLSARTVDIAPTLASRIGLSVSDELDGRVLPLGD